MTSLRTPNQTDEYHAQTLCRDLDQTGALWMVALPHEWDTHPANTIPATPATPNTSSLVRARPTMIRPPWVLENDASADAVAQFNRAWLTFDDWIDAEINLTAVIVFSFGYLASLSSDHMIGLTDSRCRSLPIDLVRRMTSLFGTPSASGDILSTPILLPPRAIFSPTN